MTAGRCARGIIAEPGADFRPGARRVAGRVAYPLHSRGRRKADTNRSDRHVHRLAPRSAEPRSRSALRSVLSFRRGLRRALAEPPAWRQRQRPGPLWLLPRHRGHRQPGAARAASSQEAQENQPLLTGDRLSDRAGSRVEVELADGTLLRVAGDSEVTFDQLADSGDANAAGQPDHPRQRRAAAAQRRCARANPRRHRQRLALPARRRQLPRRDARRDHPAGGAQRLRRGADPPRRRQRRRRRGGLDRGRRRARGARRPAPGTASSAGPRASTTSTARSRWDDDYVDTSLATRPRAWPTTAAGSAQRPSRLAARASAPTGAPTATAAGPTRRAASPGSPTSPGAGCPTTTASWDYTPGWGWAWYPGRTFAPAWVYWYWGPSYVGWVPARLLLALLRPALVRLRRLRLHLGFGFGVHGWAGGSCATSTAGTSSTATTSTTAGWPTARAAAAQLGGRDLPRGIIATGRAASSPASPRRPSEGMRTLANGGARLDQAGRASCPT